MNAKLLFLLKALIGGGLLAFVIWRIPLGDSLAVATTLDPGIFAGTVLLYFAAHLVTAAKLQLFLPGLSFWQACRFTMIGVLYGFALPGQIAGDAVKAVRLARAGGGDATAAVAAVTMDKIVGLFALLLLMTLAIGFDAGAFGQSIVLPVALGTVVIIAAFAGALFLPIPAWLGRFSAPLETWRTASMTRGRLSWALILGILFQVLCVMIHIVPGAHLNIDLSVAAWTIVVGFSAVILIAPITVAGIGVREATLVGAISYLGGSDVGAFALSLVIFVVTLIGAAVGLVFDLADRDKVS